MTGKSNSAGQRKGRGKWLESAKWSGIGGISTILGTVVGTIGALAALGIPIAFGSSTPAASVRSVSLWGTDQFFSDAKIHAYLWRQGFDVKTQSQNNYRPNCAAGGSAIRNFDLSSSSAPSASCYLQLGRANHDSPVPVQPYQGLLVIATYKPIVKLLERLHVAYPSHGIVVFDIEKYLKVYSSGMLWSQIPGNTTYQRKRRIMLGMASPDSNLGKISADLAFTAQQSDDDPPLSVNPSDPHVRVIRDLFERLGSLQYSAGDVVQAYTSGGMGTLPMAMMYEDQYLNKVVTKQWSDPTRTFMYPTPDILAADEFVGFTAKGKALVSTLQADLQSGPLTKLMASEGFRPMEDSNDFSRLMQEQGLIVPGLDTLQQDGIQITDPPRDSVLQALANAVSN